MKPSLLPPDSIRRLSGFGRSEFKDGYVFQPRTVDEICHVFQVARATERQVVLRGSGRSYGDAAVASEQVILDIRGMNRVLEWDPRAGVIYAEAGLTIEGLWKNCLADGYWPPVVSGTMFPTLAGALAANIHGKNNFRVGTLGEHVLQLDVVTSDGRELRLTPDQPEFRAIISGVGLLAVIVRVKLKMKQVPSGDVLVHAVSCRDWSEQFEAFDEYIKDWDYMVSWIDCFASGSSSGRGLFHAAMYAPDAEAERTLTIEHQELPSKVMGLFPKSQVWRILRLFNNRPLMGLINSAKHYAGKFIEDGKEHKQSLAGYSFLLDYVPDWEKAYQPDGFIQYQSFVPRSEASRVFAQQIKLQQEAGLPSFLGVLKQHRKDDFLLSHAVDGFSLALDFKVTKRNREKLWRLAHAMNDLVLGAEGRFYFAKDSTLRPQDVEDYLRKETIAEFRRLKLELDPEGLLTSSLGVRVGLIEAKQ